MFCENIRKLCKYRNVFGNPNEGLHSYRIFNLAFFDIFFTLIASYFISIKLKISFYYITLFMFILSYFIHKLFCVKTRGVILIDSIFRK